MHHTKRQQLVAAISLGFMTVFLSVLQPIPPASAQLLTKPISQETGGTGTQGKHNGNIAGGHRYPTKPIEKMDAQTLTRKSHRLIRNPQHLPLASVESSLSDSSAVGSVPSSPQSLQREGTTSQPEEPSVPRRSIGTAIPLAAISATPSAAAPTGSTATGTAPTGTIPLAAASVGTSPSSGGGSPGGRTMRRLSAEMSGFSQLVSPPSAPTLSSNPVTGGPVIGISQANLSFTAQQGGASPAAQTLSISNTGGGTLNWSASESTAWLILSPSSGTGNGSITVSVATGALTVGTHSGTITLSGGAGVTSVSVPVSFTITAAPVPPAIGTSPTSFSFTATQGGSNPATQTLSISNTGGGTLTWTANEPASWLTLSTTGGTGNGPITLTAATAGLSVGTQTTTITLTATGASPVSVPVSFTITAAPAIGVSPTSLSFTAQQGGGNPAAKTLTISNMGGGTLNWSVSHDATWLGHNPGTGTGTGTVTISVTTGFLAAGTYTGGVALHATGLPSVTIPVTFTVTPGTTTASTTLNLSPASLNYEATQGAANPTNQTISLTNTGGILNWVVSDDASWLTVSPASGSGSSTLTASVNTAGLTAQTYNGTITVSAPGTSSKTVAITLTVNAPATSSVTLSWNANTENDLAGYKIYRATTSGGYGAPIATLPGNVTTFIASGLQVGTTYFFVITAYDLAGNESPRSNEVNRSIY